MNGREIESGGHHHPQKFPPPPPPPYLATPRPPPPPHPPPGPPRPACYREIEGIPPPPRRAPPHPRRIRAWSLKSGIFIRRTGRAEPRRMVPRFAIAMSCEDYRTNPILAVTYFTSLIESVS